MTSLADLPNERVDLPGHRAGTTDYRRVVVALCAAGVATFALLYNTQALLPALAGAFDVSAGHSTLALSLTTLGLGITLLVVGPLSDAVGRTRLIHLSLAGSTVVAVATALAPSWETFLVLRFLQGVALAGLPAVATAYLREELHPSTHARAAGLYIGGTAIGGLTGRLLTGNVADLAGWRWALAATALLALACTVVVRVALPASRGFVPRTSGRGNLRRATRRALTDRGLLALYVTGACADGAFVATFNALGFRLGQAPFDLGLAQVSLVFVVYAGGAVAAGAAGRVADRVGRRAVVPIGCAVALAGLLLTLPDSLVAVVAGVAVLTAGFFVVHGVTSGWVPARAHACGASVAQAASLYLFAYYAGASVFGSLSGSAWSQVGWAGVVLLAGGLMLVAGAMSLVLRRMPTLAGSGR